SALKGIVVILLLAYVGITLYTVIKVKAFRHRPTYSKMIEYMKGDWPHNILSRYIVFRPGLPHYQKMLRSFLYVSDPVVKETVTITDILTSAGRRGGDIRYRCFWDDEGGYGYSPQKPISDRPWNRFLIERDVSRMSDDDKDLYLPRLPVTPTSKLVDALIASLGRGNVKVIPALDKVEGGSRLSAWVESAMEARPTILVEAIPYLMRTKSFHLTEFLDMVWGEEDDDVKKLLLIMTACNLLSESDKPKEVALWLRTGLDDGWIAPDSAAAFLCARLLSMPSSRDTASELLQDRLTKHGIEFVRRVASELPYFRMEVLAPQFFTPLANSDPQTCLGILDDVANTSLESAEELVAEVLSGPDSELRKGCIVKLINHRSDVGRMHMDDAFRGLAPRTVLFKSIWLLWGSAAMDEYERIARHGYIETGKTYPPLCVKGPAWSDEVSMWRSFIDSFPWFSGTDDAYYRMAYRQAESGDTIGALQTIDEFFARDFIDDDATYCVSHLLALLAMRSERTRNLYEPARYVAELINQAPLGCLYLYEDPNVDDLLRTLEWFCAESSRPRLMNMTMEDAVHWRELAEIAGEQPRGSKCLRAWEYMRRSQIRELLPMYCLTVFPDYEDEAANLVAQSAYRNMIIALRYLVRRLDEQLSSDIEAEDFGGLLAWAMMHTEWWIKDDSCRSLTDSLKAMICEVPRKYVPDVLEEEHRWFVRWHR
ncbi:hypothetical protein KJ682_18665, partial [bacterium]|nr:hypothetical protein [bacterium]